MSFINSKGVHQVYPDKTSTVSRYKNKSGSEVIFPLGGSFSLTPYMRWSREITIPVKPVYILRLHGQSETKRHRGAVFFSFLTHI